MRRPSRLGWRICSGRRPCNCLRMAEARGFQESRMPGNPLARFDDGREGGTARCPPSLPLYRHGEELSFLCLLQRGGLGGAGVEAVEEQLEGGVGLVAEIDFGTEQEHLALAHGRFGEDGTAFEVLLAPGPPSVQGIGAAKPADGVGLLEGRGGLQAEYGAVVDRKSVV